MEAKEKIKLTQYSKGAGCGCKIAPAVLEQILQCTETFLDPNLLVGYGGRDDAAVYDLGTGEALISTTDFFTPIVDDAFDFGRIAAANAISDVYAMGGRPVTAVAILGWPVEKIDPALATEVLNGARAVCKEARIQLAGGHSIDSAEPIFGLAVTGLIKKEHIKRNNTVKNGDLLFLTKPLGAGIFSTALKRGLLDDAAYRQLIAVMCRLNSLGELFGTMPGLHAMTDITGFGLAGHLLEMLGQNECSAVIDYKAIPKMDGVEAFMQQFVYPDNTTRNYAACNSKVSGMDGTEFILLCDPQTSGGLVVSVDPGTVPELKALLNKHHIPAEPIGVVTEKREFSLYFQ
jgi:selenide,water dikinase